MISSPSNKMDSEIAFDRFPAFRVYKSGRIERLLGETTVPPSLTPQNGVVSKDVIYSPEKNLSLRIYLPEKVSEVTVKNLPILIYFHGGGFIIETAFSPTYHTFLTSAVAVDKCLAISVDYRRAPEFPIPIPYEDSWDSLKWVLTHITGTGPETWINKHGDFGKVFLAGDSAGGNIAHHLTIRAKKEKLFDSLISGIILIHPYFWGKTQIDEFEKVFFAGDSAGGNISHHLTIRAEREKLETVISGIILIHPYFWGKTPIDEFEVRDVGKTKGVEGSWRVASPNSKEGVDDPWLNVVGSESSDLSGLGCGRVLVMVAGDDVFVRQGWCYAVKLKKSGWEGEVEVMETKNEGHVFHLKNPNSKNEGSWGIASPNSKNGVDDPWLNVVGSESSDLSGLGCGRVLVMVAGDDLFVRQGWCYAAKLKKSGWEGEVEVMETKNESHVFHLKNPNTDNAGQVVKKLAEFVDRKR